MVMYGSGCISVMVCKVEGVSCETSVEVDWF